MLLYAFIILFLNFLKYVYILFIVLTFHFSYFFLFVSRLG